MATLSSLEKFYVVITPSSDILRHSTIEAALEFGKEIVEDGSSVHVCEAMLRVHKPVAPVEVEELL